MTWESTKARALPGARRELGLLQRRRRRGKTSSPKARRSSPPASAACSSDSSTRRVARLARPLEEPRAAARSSASRDRLRRVGEVGVAVEVVARDLAVRLEARRAAASGRRAAGGRPASPSGWRRATRRSARPRRRSASGRRYSRVERPRGIARERAPRRRARRPCASELVEEAPRRLEAEPLDRGLADPQRVEPRRAAPGSARRPARGSSAASARRASAGPRRGASRRARGCARPRGSPPRAPRRSSGTICPGRILPSLARQPAKKAARPRTKRLRQASARRRLARLARPPPGPHASPRRLRPLDEGRRQHAEVGRARSRSAARRPARPAGRRARHPEHRLLDRGVRRRRRAARAAGRGAGRRRCRSSTR